MEEKAGCGEQTEIIGGYSNRYIHIYIYIHYIYTLYYIGHSLFIDHLLLT